MINAIFFWVILPETVKHPPKEMNYFFTNASLFVPTIEKTDPRPMTWRRVEEVERKQSYVAHAEKSSKQFILGLFPGTKVLPDDKVVREHNGSGPKEDAIV